MLKKMVDDGTEKILKIMFGAIRVSPLHCHGKEDIDKFLMITKEMAEMYSNK